MSRDSIKIERIVMAFFLSTLFVAWALTSALLQAGDKPLRNWISPGLTALAGVLVLTGTLVDNVPLGQGLPLAIALLIVAGSDFCFERSADRPGLFPLAMALGMISGLIIGITLNAVAYAAGVPLWVHLASFLIGITAARSVYLYIQVDPAFQVPVTIYLVQAAILLAGGLVSLYNEAYPFALWGIALFISDSLVGLRAFPNPERPIPWLTPSHLLFAILILYYTAQYTLVSWAL
jgi:uncharacterized protein (DUF983 family)